MYFFVYFVLLLVRKSQKNVLFFLLSHCQSTGTHKGQQPERDEEGARHDAQETTRLETEHPPPQAPEAAVHVMNAQHAVTCNTTSVQKKKKTDPLPCLGSHRHVLTCTNTHWHVPADTGTRRHASAPFVPFVPFVPIRGVCASSRCSCWSGLVDEEPAVFNLDNGRPLVDPLVPSLALDVGRHLDAQLDFIADREMVNLRRIALPEELAALEHRFESGGTRYWHPEQ